MDLETLLASLPAYPDKSDNFKTCTLVLFRQGNSNVVLVTGVSHSDAMEYCERDDTHGREYFVGWWWDE